MSNPTMADCDQMNGVGYAFNPRKSKFYDFNVGGN